MGLAVSDKPNLSYDGSTTSALTGGGTIMVDLGTFTEGAAGGATENFNITNPLVTGVNLQLDGNLSAVSALGGSPLFTLDTAPGTGAIDVSTLVPGAVSFASLASTPAGTYTATLDLTVDGILGSTFAGANNSGTFSSPMARTTSMAWPPSSRQGSTSRRRHLHPVRRPGRECARAQPCPPPRLRPRHRALRPPPPEGLRGEDF